MNKFLVAFLLLSTLVSYAQTKHPLDKDQRIRIPVVFHVIYNSQVQNVSDSLILEELNDLTNDFLNRNEKSDLHPDFKDRVGNANIEFYLADTPLQAGSKNGITRVKSAKNEKNLSSISPLVDKDRYFNVYIGAGGNVTSLNGSSVNLNYKKIGLHTHVLTHETGHWLGLYHIWGKVGSCNRFRTLFKRSDEVDDTPPQKRCSDLSFGKCPPPNRAVERGAQSNYNNFMDYCGCRCMFTKGQVIRMRSQLIEHRPLMFSN